VHIVVYFVIDAVRKLLDTPSYVHTHTPQTLQCTLFSFSGANDQFILLGSKLCTQMNLIISADNI